MSQVLLVCALLGGGPWEEVSRVDGLIVSKRPVRGVPVPEHRVEAVIAAPSARIWDVIRDTPHHHEFMPYVVESRVIKDQGDVRVLYQRLSPPVVDDRDYIMRAVGTADRALGVYELNFEVAPAGLGPPPVDGVVRVTLAKGRWLLEPIDPKSTRVVYELLTDPGGWVPAWAVGFAQRNSFPDLIEAVTERSKNPRWRP